MANTMLTTTVRPIPSRAGSLNTDTSSTRMAGLRLKCSARVSQIRLARVVSISPPLCIRPAAVNSTSATSAAGIVVYIMDPMWSYRGTLLTPEARFVVSDRGDILSPNQAPQTTAAMTSGTGMEVVEATPTRAMPMVATLPKEVPVNSAVSPLRTKARGTRIFGEISFMP